MISYFDLLKLIARNDIPEEVALHIQGRKIKYKKDIDNVDGSFNCYVIENRNQMSEDINFYLRDTLLDSQSFDKCIEVIIKDIEELPIKTFHKKQRCLANKINELIREVNKLKNN